LQQKQEERQEGEEGVRGIGVSSGLQQQQQSRDRLQPGVEASGRVALDFEAALRNAYCSADARYAAAGYAVRQLASAVQGHLRGRIPEGDLVTWLHQHVIEADSQLSRGRQGDGDMQRGAEGAFAAPAGVSHVMSQLLGMPASWLKEISNKARELAHRQVPEGSDGEREYKSERRNEGFVERYYWRCHHCEGTLQGGRDGEAEPIMGPEPVCLRCPGCGLAKYCSDLCLQRAAATHGKICSLIKVVRKVGFCSG
jgi:hypothetical protein